MVVIASRVGLFLDNHRAIANSFSDKTQFKQDEVIPYTTDFLATLCALNRLGSEAFEASVAMESESQPTVSLILPFLFNFSKKLDSDEKEKSVLLAKNLCEIHLSSVDETIVRKHVEEVFKIFKVFFLDFKSKYLESKFYDTLAISTLLDPRYKSGKSFSVSEKIRLVSKIYLLMLEESASDHKLTTFADDSGQMEANGEIEAEETLSVQDDSLISCDDTECLSDEQDTEMLTTDDEEEESGSLQTSSDESDSENLSKKTNRTKTRSLLKDTKRLKELEEQLDVSALCSRTIKHGTAFDSDSDDEQADGFASLKKEYERFVATKFKSHEDVWSWFEKNQKSFPRVYQICKKLLVIQAFSERLFSKAGIVVSSKRSSLLLDTASDLILLATNSKLINEIYPSY